MADTPTKKWSVICEEFTKGKETGVFCTKKQEEAQITAPTQMGSAILYKMRDKYMKIQFALGTT